MYIFDLTNNFVIADYAIDASYSPADPEQSLTSFSQPLKVAEDGSGSFYKLRITNHVSNIINEDSDNVKLGLVVVPNINTLAVRDQQGAVTGALNSATKDAPALIDQLPSGTLLTPYGTVLHGNLSADDEKRLKLNIFYTNFN